MAPSCVLADSATKPCHSNSAYTPLRRLYEWLAMSMRTTEEHPTLTYLLQQWSEGDHRAADALFDQVYGDLRRLAGRYFRPAGSHLAAHRVAKWSSGSSRKMAWQNRSHFFGIAATLMRRILVDLSRASPQAGRGPQEGSPGGGLEPVPASAPGPARPGGRPPGAGALGSSQSLGGGAPVLRRADRRGDRGVSGDLSQDRGPGVAQGPGLSVSTAPAGDAEWTLSAGAPSTG